MGVPGYLLEYVLWGYSGIYPRVLGVSCLVYTLGGPGYLYEGTRVSTRLYTLGGLGHVYEGTRVSTRVCTLG